MLSPYLPTRTLRRAWLLLAPFAAVAIASVAVAAVAVAGETTESPYPSFAEIVDVRVINVEVVATHRGERVSDLKAEDFRLLIDGNEVGIDYFTQISEGRAVSSGSAGEAVGRRVLVFVDDYFAIPVYRNRVLENLRSQLDLLAAADKMAIVAFDGHEIELLSPWTDSKDELGEALDRAQERTAYGLRRRSDQRRFGSTGLPSGFQASSSFSSIGFAGSSNSRNRDRISTASTLSNAETQAQVARVVRATASTLRGFARPSGRKVMLILTGGWPALSTHPGSLGGNSRRLGPTERFRTLKPLIETANRLGYTLYPVDLQPLAAGARRAAQSSDSRDSLLQLALSTGGKAFQSAASQIALEQTLADTRSYYSLGFVPTWQGDDREHRLEIKVRRPKVKLRTRTRFTDLSRQSEMDLLFEGAQLFGSDLPGADLAVRLGRPQRSGQSRWLVPLALDIPLAELTLLRHGEQLHGAVEIRISARDTTGATTETPMRTQEIRRGEAPQPGDVEKWQASIKLRNRCHDLLVTLHEPTTGELWSKKIKFEP